MRIFGLLAFLVAATLPAADDITLYRVHSPFVPTTDRFVTPTQAEPPILNPPGFRWPSAGWDATYDLQLSRTRDFSGRVFNYPRFKLNLFTLDRPLEEGVWYWRARADQGRWSAVREFAVKSGLPSIPVPPFDFLINKIKQTPDPRVLVERDNLKKWRAAIDGPRRAEWEAFIGGYEKRFDRLPTADPALLKDARGASAENNRIFLQAMNRAEEISEAAQAFALSALLTGNRKHAEQARKLLLALAAWDPRGSTGIQHSDTAFRSATRGLYRSYDWLSGAGALTAEDRLTAERVMAIRGNDFAAWFNRAKLNERWPYTSHTYGGLPYFGEMAAVFVGVLPEAEGWLRFCVYMMTANYPCFGRSDGSWSEGGRYWHVSHDRHMYPLRAMSEVLGLNLLAHPFLVNTGYFKIYANPPWDKITVFGDGHDQAVGGGDARVVGTLGYLLGNPEYAWYSSAIRARMTSGRAQEFLALDPSALVSLAARSTIREMPLARVFPDAGVAALRTDLTDGSRDIEFLLKADPFGPGSHAHQDQGNFYLAAYGEPLLTPSGHYQGHHELIYGSPHHFGWTFQSWAHNVPLIDGKGQARSAEAGGQIEHFYHSPVVDYVRADVTPAYRANNDAEAVRAVRRFAPDMVQRMGSANVVSFRRAIVFLRPATFVMFDDVESPAPARLNWLLHSANRFTVDEPQRLVTAVHGKAKVDVKLLDGPVARISQTGDYLIPVPKEFKTEWHLTAEFSPTAHHQVVAVLSPSRTGGESKPADSPDCVEAHGADWAGAVLRWSDGRRVELTFASTAAGKPGRTLLRAGAAKADAALLVVQAGPDYWAYAADARSLQLGDKRWNFASPVDVLLTTGGGRTMLRTATEQKVSVERVSSK